MRTKALTICVRYVKLKDYRYRLRLCYREISGYDTAAAMMMVHTHVCCTLVRDTS